MLSNQNNELKMLKNSVKLQETTILVTSTTAVNINILLRGLLIDKV